MEVVRNIKTVVEEMYNEKRGYSRIELPLFIFLYKKIYFTNLKKHIGMPLKEIREYLELAEKGDNSLEERYNTILNQKQYIKDQIQMLKQ